jgi:hypothetical protein
VSGGVTHDRSGTRPTVLVAAPLRDATANELRSQLATKSLSPHQARELAAHLIQAAATAEACLLEGACPCEP